jgi:hypothetical protein
VIAWLTEVKTAMNALRVRVKRKAALPPDVRKGSAFPVKFS